MGAPSNLTPGNDQGLPNPSGHINARIWRQRRVGFNAKCANDQATIPTWKSPAQVPFLAEAQPSNSHAPVRSGRNEGLPTQPQQPQSKFGHLLEATGSTSYHQRAHKTSHPYQRLGSKGRIHHGAEYRGIRINQDNPHNPPTPTTNSQASHRDSTFSHFPPPSNANFPHSGYLPMDAQSPDYASTAAPLGASYSTNPPVGEKAPLDTPSFTSEPTHLMSEGSTEHPYSAPFKNRGGADSGNLESKGKLPESGRDDDIERFTVRPRTPPPNQAPGTVSHSRVCLFVRQQPIAARACKPGDKCRRPIDPIPIIQLLMTDFSPESMEDKMQLASNQYIVSCHLSPIAKEHGGANEKHPSKQTDRGEINDPDSNLSAGRTLSGNCHAGPFSVKEDPDPTNAPPHPRSAPNQAINSASVLRQTSGRLQSPNPPASMPATFFIFPDLSICKVGRYRLRFQLMDVHEALRLGCSPILHEVYSEPFQVFHARDFPGLQPTPLLTARLRSLGAVGINA
ncbi:hypothetical protein PAAG_08283 [Paracoccidioides lutzii Pb01]|uniref:Velvet domain-containing protein n=1 Tax=Paracoccidioides lutzii (strain ATCC MYA-826 / Pb01) TaxID=502779 RepID=C1HBZ2_PARBA|nr:hypothetical protein PAAG_08283 [Paracoccidioides lutzii Pb01]EEH38556.2 hypothetical protein PAAG_08283 [Paracoccidioides lutzii Pb01]